MTIGQRLAAARQHANLTQNTVAAELHVARQTISSWETERTYPDMMSIVALAKLYRLSLDDLIREDTDLMKAWTKKDAALREARVLYRVSMMLDVGFMLLLLGLCINAPGFAMDDGVGLLLLLMAFTNVLALSRARRYYQTMQAEQSLPKWVWRTVVFSLVVLMIVTRILRFRYAIAVIGIGYAVFVMVMFWPDIHRPFRRHKAA
ncbi:helix-turn-helix transcriptional regulator [Schleiferilactobacillus harbinensis]|uniref:helix-turn-helix domain-containing protein n=1 Tax=Schleiferilactobacillus harbinensis TaxID=304207 RepID=UPI001167C162|nr:helix-turn-helix transcriptional regulator [Schleiferilactobacillus harbinensis]MBO3093120.1 helix-turn-helix transcriptional regulator [Schleiferilactobacillus harbinensis]QEU47922.1 helix-turn-helix transcriptional regulator [Schleiferilactobacillus harbinensis]GEK07692.1 hypothetical protein LHA01_29310 [Schleiferilactobacillus harbinensis]